MSKLFIFGVGMLVVVLCLFGSVQAVIVDGEGEVEGESVNVYDMGIELDYLNQPIISSQTGESIPSVSLINIKQPDILVKSSSTQKKPQPMQSPKPAQPVKPQLPKYMPQQFQIICKKQWIKIGTFNHIPEIFKVYPVTKFQFGTMYNGPLIMPIIINNWTKGFRILTKDVYVSGDEADKMKPVRSMWTQGTKDAKSNEGDWLHQYVDLDFRPFGSNGKMDRPLYARLL